MDAKCKKFEEALEDLHVGLSLPRRMKNFVLVEQKVGRLKNEFSMVSHLYDIKVSPKEGTDHAASVVYHRSQRYDERQAFIGGYVIRTSLTDWDLQTTVQYYHRLTEIEATFRVMKSDLGLRSIYHQEDRRIEGHMFIRFWRIWCERFSNRITSITAERPYGPISIVSAMSQRNFRKPNRGIFSPISTKISPSL